MQPLPGKLFVTNYRLVWEPAQAQEPQSPAAPAEAAAAFAPLLAIDRVRSRRDEAEIAVDICLKYDALPALRVAMAEVDAHHMGTLIKRHQAARARLEESFAVAHGAALGAARPAAGWRLYSPEAEFQRQGCAQLVARRRRRPGRDEAARSRGPAGCPPAPRRLGPPLRPCAALPPRRAPPPPPS